jgi:hypothetical protein
MFKGSILSMSDHMVSSSGKKSKSRSIYRGGGRGVGPTSLEGEGTCKLGLGVGFRLDSWGWGRERETMGSRREGRVVVMGTKKKCPCIMGFVKGLRKIKSLKKKGVLVKNNMTRDKDFVGSGIKIKITMVI